MSGSVVAITPPPPPPPEPVVATSSFSTALASAQASTADLSSSAQSMVENYSSSVTGNGLAGSTADATIQRGTEFISAADSTAGVNLSDGLSGDEYLLVAQNISGNSELSNAFKALDVKIGPDGAQYFGQYGVEGRNLLDAAGNAVMSVDDAAAAFNEATGFGSAQASVEEGTTAEEAAGGEAPAEEAAAGAEAPAEEAAAGGEAPAEEAPAEGAGGGGGAEGGGISDLWSMLLSLFDTDGDGKISPEEFKAGMAKLDTDGDGKLSKDELVAGGMSEEQADQMMTAMDADGDGAISLEGADGEASELDTFVTELNADGDSEITEAELGELVTPATAATDTNAELEMA
jgi:hypothetical protein